MHCTVRVYLHNDHFSQEYADEHNNGQESELNRRFEWEDELEIKQAVVRVEEFVEDEVVLQGTMPDGAPFHETVPNMRRFILFDEEGTPVAQIACSECLFDTFEEIVEGDNMEVRVYLKDREPLSNPVPGIYIAARDYPKTLIFE